MPTNLEKLRGLLQELFQLDQADLDFGIYRIMNQKREEVVRFLDRDLLPQVQEAFSHYQSADKTTIQAELKKAEEQVRGLGMNPDDAPKVKELRQKLTEAAVDVAALENEVFSHLFNFFRRYYSEGDFLSLRRYKEGVYAIPYEGEEVKLHWANADQYYVKSSEYLRDYAFKVKITAGPGSPSEERRVHFKLVEASTEQNNNKPANGKERRFILVDEDPVVEEGSELFIRFVYQPDADGRKQAELNTTAVERLVNPQAKPTKKGKASKPTTPTANLAPWIDALSRKAPSEKNPDRTVLEKHLTQYTARNTFDYFIHKDLGGFLRRELDFFIKNEVMHLDDVENETVPRVEQYLSKIKVIRKIAHKIIAFLEQLENFQKKLWLKKKFVVETNYCVTLDRVPEELYPEIAKNDAQREEWVRLFAIDEIKKDLNQPGYSKPLTVDFLKAHPHLVLDTALFNASFKHRVLHAIEDLDGKLAGLLVNGENFQGLGLIAGRYYGKVDCIYIDPPYNTGSDGFVYKDNYQKASWNSLVSDRLAIAYRLLSGQGSFFVSIDDIEVPYLRIILDTLFGPDNFVAANIWQKRYSRDNRPIVGTVHEYVLLYARSADLLEKVRGLLPPDDKSKSVYRNPNKDPQGPWRPIPMNAQGFRPNQMYAITSPGGAVHHPPEGRCWSMIESEYKKLLEEGRIWFGQDGNAQPNVIRYLSEVEGFVPWTWWPSAECGHTDESKKEVYDLVTKGFAFETPKPVRLLTRVLQIATNRLPSATVLDFFAGSGTTGHATISLNRDDDGSRRYILIEMGDYFDSLLRLRIAKAIYSSEWEDGKPVGRNGVSHMLKYIRLESYEDALNNLELKRTSQQQKLLDDDKDLREQYVLSYMLDVESRGSASLLNVERFRNPDQYQLRVERNGESKLVNVDLVETFNWLLGLTVKHIDVIRGVRVVSGTNPQNERVLVLWRNVDELDNDALDKWFEKQGYSTRDLEFDLIYANGDNNLENLRRADQTWKVRLIEEEFHRLMFDVEDV